MRVRSSLKWVLTVGVLSYVATVGDRASAQPGGPAPASANTGAAAQGQVGFQRKTQLTPQEQLGEAQRHIARMESASATVQKMLGEARGQRDVVKTLCLNDKLSQIDVALRSGRDRRQALQGAVTRNDVELSNHQFTILTVLRQRVEQLMAESNQCVGEEGAFVGSAGVKVFVDPSIPPDEAPYPPTDPTLVVTPPPCTSCTL